MDAGIAALLGASIGAFASLLAGVVGPWVRDVVTRKSLERADFRARMSAEIIVTVEAFGAMVRARQNSTPDNETKRTTALVSITRVAVLLGSDEAAIEILLVRALMAIHRADVKDISPPMSDLQVLLHSWYRGDLSADAALQAFDERVARRAAAAETEALALLHETD